MIRSLQKIEHVQPNGATTLLLDFGDYIESEIEIGAEQQTTGFSPIGAAWGLATAEGGARRSFSFSRRLDHASHSAVRSWAYSHPSLMPFGKEGVIRITIREAEDAPEEIWELQSAVIQGCSARPLFDVRSLFRSLTTYQITGGKMIPIQGNFGNCYPIDWQTYNIDEDETLIGDDECEVVPPYVPDPPVPGPPGHLVPEMGNGGVILAITGEGLTLDFPVASGLLSEEFRPNGLSAFGQPQWRTDAISGYYLTISNDWSADTWAMRAVPSSPGPNLTLSASDGPYANPWTAAWLAFDLFGTGTGTPVVVVLP